MVGLFLVVLCLGVVLYLAVGPFQVGDLVQVVDLLHLVVVPFLVAGRALGVALFQEVVLFLVVDHVLVVVL